MASTSSSYSSRLPCARGASAASGAGLSRAPACAPPAAPAVPRWRAPVGRSSPLRRRLGQAIERGGGGLQRALDVLGVVRERGKPSLELGRRRIYAAGEQLATPLRVGVGVTGLRVG